MNVLIRGLSEGTVAALKRRAARNGRSLQAEMRQILERAAVVDTIDAAALAERIRRKLEGRTYSDSTLLVAEDRER